jgi:hypothetical protein
MSRNGDERSGMLEPEIVPIPQRRSALRGRLMASYQASAERDHGLAEEWRPLEEEVWEEYVESVEKEE